MQFCRTRTCIFYAFILIFFSFLNFDFETTWGRVKGTEGVASSMVFWDTFFDSIRIINKRNGRSD